MPRVAHKPTTVFSTGNLFWKKGELPHLDNFLKESDMKTRRGVDYSLKPAVNLRKVRRQRQTSDKKISESTKNLHLAEFVNAANDLDDGDNNNNNNNININNNEAEILEDNPLFGFGDLDLPDLDFSDFDVDAASDADVLPDFDVDADVDAVVYDGEIEAEVVAAEMINIESASENHSSAVNVAAAGDADDDDDDDDDVVFLGRGPMDFSNAATAATASLGDRMDFSADAAAEAAVAAGAAALPGDLLDLNLVWEEDDLPIILPTSVPQITDDDIDELVASIMGPMM